MAARWVDALEDRFGGWHLPGLAAFLVGMNAAVAVLTFLKPEFPSRLTLDPAGLYAGEVWRLGTFLFVPPAFGPLWTVFWLFMLFSILRSLENRWGDFRFNLYCLLGIAFMGTYSLTRHAWAPNTGLMTSFFLAFAHLFPEVEVLLFFLFPVKMRWLGAVAWVLVVLQALAGGFGAKLFLAASLGNYLAFFGPDHWRDIQRYIRQRRSGN